MKKLSVAFVFHANQSLNGIIPWADMVCYRNLFDTLLAHDRLKFVMHVSGTLLHGLNNFFPERIEMIRKGVSRGQFELLGSTYSQNILYSSTDYENRLQIALHKELISNLFDYIPEGFWNPERCWNQQYVELIAGSGYRYTLIEEHFLRAAGAEGHINALRTTSYNQKKLILITDDMQHQIKFNDAVGKGRIDELIAWYRHYYETMPDGEDIPLSYAEDAEATGMWQEINNQSGASAIANLDRLLSRLEKEEWLQITTYKEYIDSRIITNTVATIPDGQATWMVDSSKKQGFKDWFDFNARYEGLVHYRAVFTAVSEAIKAAEDKMKPLTPPQQKLINYAKHLFAICHYEFGCAFGSAGTDDSIYPMCNKGAANWESVGLVWLILEAAGHTGGGLPSRYSKDIDGDGIVEMVYRSGSLLYILSPVGGKLLFLFDLASGAELVGNVLFEDFQRKWQHNSTFTYEYNTKNLVGVDFPVRFKRRGFEESIRVNNRFIGDETKIERIDWHEKWVLRYCSANTVWACRSDDESAEFTLTYDHLIISKVYRFSEDRVSVCYTFTSEDNKPRKIELHTMHGYTLDPVALLNRTSAQQIQCSDDAVGLIDSNLGIEVHLTAESDGEDHPRFVRSELLLGTLFVSDAVLRLKARDSSKVTFIQQIRR